MDEIITAIPAGLSAFAATNLDDILILMLLFSQVDSALRRNHIIAGQYLGFAILVIASLSGLVSQLFLPRPWIGMLGLIPILIGLSRLLNPQGDADETQTSTETPASTEQNSFFQHFLSPQTYGVAAITFANGGDNIGIYVPLFANSGWQSLGVILTVFFIMVGVWCYAAYQLTQVPVIANRLTAYGNYLVPYVLMGLGVLILLDSHTLENRGLTVLALIISAFCVASLMRNAGSSSLDKLSKSSPAEEH
jgi:cadmium resistance transport/sequestration family protein